MVGWHHRLDRHEFEQAPGDSEGQGNLVCCSLWGRKESDSNERLNNKTSLTVMEPTRGNTRIQNNFNSHITCLP